MFYEYAINFQNPFNSALWSIYLQEKLVLVRDTNFREDSVLRLKRIWLDKMGITQIDNLEMLGNITHIHLDFNVISTIEVIKDLLFFVV